MEGNGDAVVTDGIKGAPPLPYLHVWCSGCAARAARAPPLGGEEPPRPLWEEDAPE